MNRRHSSMTVVSALIALMMITVSSSTLAQDGSGSEKSLYERLGGLAPISVVVSDFLDALIPDPQLNENPAIDAARKRVPAPYLKYQVTAFVCEAAGGPCTYQGRGMEESHAHLNITGQEWDRMVTIFQDVLATHNVPEQEQQDLLQLLGTTKGEIVTAR